MIAWIVGTITAILAFFVIWRAASPEFRARAEEPKYRFLENLGIQSQNTKEQHPQGGSR